MELEELIWERTPAKKEVIISKRFQKDGAPIPWQLEAISAEQWRRIAGAGEAALAAATVRAPDLEDQGLKESYGVKDSAMLLKKMLRPGEYLRLMREVKEINGFQAERKARYVTAKN